MGFFGRTIAGAIGGAAIGGWGNAPRSDMMGGAIFGGLAGGLGVKMGVNMLKKRGINPAGVGAALVERGGRGLTAAASTIGNRPIFDATMRMRTMANRAAARMGRNSVSINKYGGYAFGALGTAAAANIGSSVLSSNRAR